MKNKISLLILFLVMVFMVQAQSVDNDTTDDWPVLTTYDQNHIAKIAMPIGGIGTGTVSLGGRGDLRDWEIMNTAAKGYTPTSEN